MRWMSARRPGVATVTAGAGIAAVLLALVLTGCAGLRSAGGQPVPASAIPRLTAIASNFATVNGGNAPAQVSAVLTTHKKALTSATPGDTVAGAGRDPVYLLTLTGHFVAYTASYPPGASAPTGRFASIVVDARTFRVLDWGVGPKPPPVSPASLGPVTYLPR
jgi:hypothetical protein